jgi:ABC-2 type transport system ATP-binding protein
VEGLRKAFGKVRAVDGVDFEVAPGTILGLLGPNGAGKTTIVRILTTLLTADQGRAEVAGYDVVRDAAGLRSVIGLAGQYAAVDENLTGRENLELVGVLYHIGKDEARRRAGELLERFGLAQAGNREVKTYSGGMRRRLDLAASLVGRPAVLFLDEPTTGLDPHARMGVWELVNDLRAEGLGIVLTTHYMDEAERLSDALTVLAQGKVVAHGSAKTVLGDLVGEHVVVLEADALTTAAVAPWLTAHGLTPPAAVLGFRHLTLRAEELADFARAFPSLRYEVRAPNLDDLFMKLSLGPCAG